MYLSTQLIRDMLMMEHSSIQAKKKESVTHCLEIRAAVKLVGLTCLSSCVLIIYIVKFVLSIKNSKDKEGYKLEKFKSLSPTHSRLVPFLAGTNISNSCLYYG